MSEQVKMPVGHFLRCDYLHILFYIKFLGFCLLAPDEIRILCGKNKEFSQKSAAFIWNENLQKNVSVL